MFLVKAMLLDRAPRKGVKREKRRGPRMQSSLEKSREEDESTKQIKIVASEVAEAGECHVGEPGEGSVSRRRQ